MQFKPEKAKDWDENKLILPAWQQPKIDGVCSLNRDGKFIGRTLKPHANKYITSVFSRPAFHGFHGELFLTELGATHPDLCRNTTSAVNRIQGEPKMTWTIFNYVTDNNKHLSYRDRMSELNFYVESLIGWGVIGTFDIRCIQSVPVNTLEEVEETDESFLNLGYEGSILRDPNSLYKFGRSDSKMQCWRIKRFIEEEFMITGFAEGNKNNNEATVNLLGRTERSSHQENLEPNGMIGNFIGYTLKDIVDPSSKQLLIPKGTEITVSAGKLPHDLRKKWFENPSLFMHKIGKFKTFPKGVKDKPRFPVFVTLVDNNYSLSDTDD